MSLTTCFSATEDELLQGLPAEAQLIYLRGLRRYMNYSTGIVGGRERRICWLMLCEILEVHAHQGVKASKPDKSKVRRLVGWLERAGLAKKIEDADSYLVFYLPIAKKDVYQDVDSSAQKKADIKPTQSRHSQKSSHNAGYGTGSDIPKTAKADTHLISHNSNTNTTTTNEVEIFSDKAKVSSGEEVGGRELIFPSGLSPEIKHAISLHLASCPIDWKQPVLDELSGRIKTTGVENPVTYAWRLVERTLKGKFIPDVGLAIAAARKNRKIDFQFTTRRQPKVDDPAKAQKKALISEKMAAAQRAGDYELYQTLGREFSRLDC